LIIEIFEDLLDQKNQYKLGRIEGVGKKKVVVFDGKYDRCKEYRRCQFYYDITQECQF
ncbi:8247_t:CDS:2, partial [Scutellospora calospora]